MEKKIVILSILCVIAIVLAGCTPALASKTTVPSTDHAKVPIEVTRYIGKHPVQTIALVSPTDALRIKQCLIELYDAKVRNDQDTVARCIALLKQDGILRDRQDQNLVSPQKPFPDCVQRSFPGIPQNSAGDNLSNSVCFFNAIGQGMIYGTITIQFIQAITNILRNQTNPFLAFILLLVFLPLLILVILINDLIPFRILMPTGVLVMANGSATSIGLAGFKHTKVGADHIQVNLSLFTGLTINIPPLTNESKPFTFVSGFALKADQII